MNLMPPLVSVLMTAYNRQQYIAEAIESVLASTYKNFELIIVDDCSIDNTVAIAKSYEEKDSRIKVFANEQNLGDYPNRNKAASYAKGKYIKYLDSDDIMYPHCLEVMVNAMEKFPEACYGLSSVGNVSFPFPQCITPSEAYKEHFGGLGHFERAPGSAIILKRVFDEVGGFKSKKYVGDTELWFTLSQQYNLVKFQRDLVWDRSHLESEKIYEKAEKGISEKRKVMTKNFLEHPSCPLTEDEIKQLKKKLKNKTLKNYIRKLV